MIGVIPDVLAIKRAVRARLLERVGEDELQRLSPPERRLRVRAEVMSVLDHHRALLPAQVLTEVVNQVSDGVVGLGPVERLLKDPEVSEVMVNGADDVYVERKGRIERVDGLLFEGEEQVFHLIERIVAPLGLRVDESSPYVDARLADGSRVHAIVPPLSLCGPVITIRKFTLRPFTPEELVALGTMNEETCAFLCGAVRARANIVVSGGTGSGKTSLLGALASFIPASERLITIEDAAELRLPQPHVVGLEARPANVEGVGEVTVRDLVRNALRMRPDRIIVGEVRGREALDMLQAMNTGHEGSMSTAHANSARDVLSRLETMALMSDVDLPVTHVRDQMANAVDLIVQMSRTLDGRRVIEQVAVVAGVRGRSLLLEDVFHRDRRTGRTSRGVGWPMALDRLSRRAGAVDTTSPLGRAEPLALPPGKPADAVSGVPTPASTDMGRPDAPAIPASGAAGRGRQRRAFASWPGHLRRLGSVLE